MKMLPTDRWRRGKYMRCCNTFTENGEMWGEYKGDVFLLNWPYILQNSQHMWCILYLCLVLIEQQRLAGCRCWLRSWPAVFPLGACSVSPAEAMHTAGAKRWPSQLVCVSCTEPVHIPCTKSSHTVYPGQRRRGMPQNNSEVNADNRKKTTTLTETERLHFHWEKLQEQFSRS